DHPRVVRQVGGHAVIATAALERCPDVGRRDARAEHGGQFGAGRGACDRGGLASVPSERLLDEIQRHDGPGEAQRPTTSERETASDGIRCHVRNGMSFTDVRQYSCPVTMSLAERRKAELRREIIDAAFTCFAENGYHATGIADIAARLGIGHGTFYRYF